MTRAAQVNWQFYGTHVDGGEMCRLVLARDEVEALELAEEYLVANRYDPNQWSIEAVPAHNLNRNDT